MKRLFWPVLTVGLALVAFDLVPWRFLLAPLLGWFIFAIGTASFRSLGAGAAHVPSGPPAPVGAGERLVYTCSGCGAEVLLLVRGADVPPRHCGERMQERREVAAFSPN